MSNAQVIEATLEVIEQDVNPVELLSEHTGISRSKIKKAMLLGAVWRTIGKSTRRIRRAKKDVHKGDILNIYYDEKVLSIEPPKPTLVSDGGSFSIWFKPSGLMSSGTKFGDHCAINRWVEQHHEPQRPVFIVHRLDRFASGLLVLAHTKRAAAHLSAQFQDRTVKKIYRAVVQGELTQSQTIDAPLDGKEAISIVSPIESNGTVSLVEIDIKTGRKHQIRRHLSGIGFPVCGDRQYGTLDGKKATGDMILTACELHITHPKTEQIKTYILDKSLQPHL